MSRSGVIKCVLSDYGIGDNHGLESESISFFGLESKSNGILGEIVLGPVLYRVETSSAKKRGFSTVLDFLL